MDTEFVELADKVKPVNGCAYRCSKRFCAAQAELVPSRTCDAVYTPLVQVRLSQFNANLFPLVVPGALVAVNVAVTTVEASARRAPISRSAAVPAAATRRIL